MKFVKQLNRFLTLFINENKNYLNYLIILEKSMRLLLKKLHHSTAKSEPAAYEQEHREEIEELKGILKKYNIEGSEKLLHQIVDWKFQ